MGDFSPRIAKERGIGSWVTSALESNVGLNSIAQWCATLAPHMPQGLGTGQLFTDNIPYPLAIQGDCLWFLPEQPEIPYPLAIQGDCLWFLPEQPEPDLLEIEN